MSSALCPGDVLVEALYGDELQGVVVDAAHGAVLLLEKQSNYE
jgi:hypothetical protein